MSKLNKYKLSEIAYIKMGQSPDGESCNEDGIGIPLLNGPSEFTDFYPIPKQFTINAKRFSEEGEILFCVRGSTTGRMNWSNGTYAIGRGLASITHKEGKQLNHFLKYLIHSNLDSILKAANGSTFPNLTSDIFSSFELSVPDLLTQQKIASVLSSLDAKIELNNRINTELEAMAKTLYDYWFVQFDFPDAEDKPYKSSGGAMIWSEELKREIPKKWEVARFGDLINIFDSKRIPLSNIQREKKKGCYPYYGATSIMDYIDDFIFDGDYILIAEDGSVMDENGLPIVQFIWGKTWVNNHAHVLQAKNIYNNEYIFYLSKSISVVQIMTGSIQKKINQENLLNVKIVLPYDNLINSFCDFVNPLRKRKINLIEENQQLAQLRDWLLPMLMNGQVVVG